jgi:hypothetical protein
MFIFSYIIRGKYCNCKEGRKGRKGKERKARRKEASKQTIVLNIVTKNLIFKPLVMSYLQAVDQDLGYRAQINY